MAGFGAIGGLRIAANLNLEYVKGGGEAGLEQYVKDFAPLWLGIIDKKTGRRSATAQSPDAMERQFRSDGEAVGLVVGDDDVLRPLGDGKRFISSEDGLEKA